MSRSSTFSSAADTWRIDRLPPKGRAMNPFLKANCISLLLAMATVGAQAQTAAPKTREQVRQELSEALRDGSMISGEAALAMRELNPGRYPQAPSAPMRTRDSVRAEFEAARRSGDLFADGDSGLKLNELYPTRYPQPTVVAGKTRSEVKAELAEALRTGDMLAGGDSGLKLNELNPGVYPRAAAPVYASAPSGVASAATH
jgi:hypothetical protein